MDNIKNNDLNIITLPPMKGGAWKVAYADFVTAMMAFFLLMWLLSATTEEQRSGIADYFDPKVPISQTSAGGMGMFNGDTVFAQNRLSRNGLGGAGKKAAAGRDDKQKQEVSSSEDVWSKGSNPEQMLGNKQQVALTEQQKADFIENEINRQIKNISPDKDLSEHIQFKISDEGIRIDITDKKDTPMFLSGSDKPTKKMKQILAVVASVISPLDNRIVIAGHTDAQTFKSKRNFGNWELSSQRALVARRNLVEVGIKPEKIERVEGRADRDLIFKDDPTSARNRRIAILLLRNKNSSPKVLKEGLQS